MPRSTDLDTDVARCWEANAEAWTALSRRGYDAYRDLLNAPAFLALLPDVRGRAGLDVGCGEGHNTRLVARRGARMTAIDVSPTFVRHARDEEARAPLGITYREASATALPLPDGAFDFAMATMSLMDISDVGAVLREVHRVLAPRGFFQFSILHPCFVPDHRRAVRDAAGRVTAVELAGYFDSVQGQVEEWTFSAAPPEERAGFAPFRVPRFNRTLGEWVAHVVSAGLAIECMSEPRPDAAAIAQYAPLDHTAVLPFFLHVRARKAG